MLKLVSHIYQIYFGTWAVHPSFIAFALCLFKNALRQKEMIFNMNIGVLIALIGYRGSINRDNV